MSWFLSRLVNPGYLKDREFEYWRACLREKDSQDFRQNPVTGSNKGYYYFKDPFDEKWRFADHPYHVRGILRIFAVATLVLFGATCLLRTMQIALVLPEIFFKTFRESFSHKEEESFSETLAKTFESKIGDQKEAFYTIGRLFARDVKCSLTMEIAALVGGFSGEINTVIKMQVIFSNSEREWNQEKTPDKSLVALWIRALKTRSPSEIDWLEIQSESNQSFYLYQCAQPVGEELLARIQGVERFDSYQAICDHIEADVQRLEREKAARGEAMV